jgi:hypothetical protein
VEELYKQPHYEIDHLSILITHHFGELWCDKMGRPFVKPIIFISLVHWEMVFLVKLQPCFWGVIAGESSYGGSIFTACYPLSNIPKLTTFRSTAFGHQINCPYSVITCKIGLKTRTVWSIGGTFNITMDNKWLGIIPPSLLTADGSCPDKVSVDIDITFWATILLVGYGRLLPITPQ